MKKSYRITLPLSIEESFDLLLKSGGSITSWSKSKADRKQGYLEWKQGIWALTGSAVIIANLKQRRHGKTVVTVDILKPFQLIDPFSICDRIFAKLEKNCARNFPSDGAETEEQ